MAIEATSSTKVSAEEEKENPDVNNVVISQPSSKFVGVGAPKFKKGNKRALLAKKKQFRRSKKENGDTETGNEISSSTGEQDEDDEDDELATFKAIQNTKKRRMLINNLENSRGIATSALLESSSDPKFIETKNVNTKTTTNVSGNDRLDLAKFGSSSYGHGTVGEHGDEDQEDHPHSVMGAKHKESMETYIRNKQNNLRNSNATEHATTIASQVPVASSNVNVAAKEGDVGAGGAMLGGTGIAEVILPLDHRIRNIQQTEEAARAREKKYRNRGGNATSVSHSLSQTSNTPSNSASVSSAGKNVLPSDVSGVGASYSHNFQLHNQDWIQRRLQEKEYEKKSLENEHNASKSQYADSDANRERAGFDAIRKAKNASVASGGKDGASETGSSRNMDIANNAPSQNSSGANSTAKPQYHQRSSDDRVWGTFVKNQRSRGRM